MKTNQFKTNIMCGDCIAKVTPVLNETFGEHNWKVNIKDTKRILSVSSEKADEKTVQNVLAKAGCKAEELV